MEWFARSNGLDIIISSFIDITTLHLQTKFGTSEVHALPLGITFRMKGPLLITSSLVVWLFLQIILPSLLALLCLRLCHLIITVPNQIVKLFCLNISLCVFL